MESDGTRIQSNEKRNRFRIGFMSICFFFQTNFIPVGLHAIDFLHQKSHFAAKTFLLLAFIAYPFHFALD